MQSNVILGFVLFCGWINGILGRRTVDSLFPVVANVARKAVVSTNATCGQNGPEFYCRLVMGEFFRPHDSQYCDVCDAHSLDDPGQQHPIRNIVDGGEAWWQSPSLAHGMKYDHVTVTLDLGQVYQVSYVNIKVALSPRPGNWILEKSIDGSTYLPWQYFAISDADCWLKYSTAPMIGRPKHLRDNQVLCTSHFSRMDPLQNGTIFISLVRGRTSAFHPSQNLMNFLSARYVRLRFLKMRKLNNDRVILMMNRPADVDGAILRRYFYTIKEIEVGAQCHCHGHATSCSEADVTGEPLCECKHNTCGATCNECCPKYNQKPWQPSSAIAEFVCEECNCHGHSDECVYNSTVARTSLSSNMMGVKSGGGVCLNCRGHTEGMNCERCVFGYYRPSRSPLMAHCLPCDCNEVGTTGKCVQDSSMADQGKYPGDCVCQERYGGPVCDRCAPGYRDHPWCEECPCHRAGSLNEDICTGCVCKKNVEGVNCDRCVDGHYDLRKNNPEGCSPCFCFGVSGSCNSVNWGKTQIQDMSQWRLSGFPSSAMLTDLPRTEEGWLVLYGTVWGRDTIVTQYWQAPTTYLGNMLTSYGGVLEYTVRYETAVYSQDTHHLAEPDLILQGDELAIAKPGQFYRENEKHTKTIALTETDWYKQERPGAYFSQPVSKAEFMTVMASLNVLLIRATYHSGQVKTQLRDVILEVASETGGENVTMGSVEQCTCPPGYSGMSCEHCDPGYRRVNRTMMEGKCERCDCHGLSDICDPVTGKCQACRNNTAGNHCDDCWGGFYGDPARGIPCEPCGCPLVEALNNFAVDCVLEPTEHDPTAYMCLSCETGHNGPHCNLCTDGFFGDPLKPGNYCQRCQCNNNIDLHAVGNCDTVTGECFKCLNHTQGFRCDECQPGFYGNAEKSDCRACDCDEYGGLDGLCDPVSGQCHCRPHYTGQYCDHCEAGFGNVEAGCLPCNCSSTGSFHQVCDPVSGQCDCKAGAGGLSCNSCKIGYFGLSVYGCSACDCDPVGGNSTLPCDPDSGQCRCLPHVMGLRCDQCQMGFWNITSGIGCESCDCHQEGSWDITCEPITGQCSCKPGVGGWNCSVCEDGFYGFSPKGCKECSRCKSRWHVCHPDTGRCVCPPHTEGERCHSCGYSSWGHDPIKGCKLCECHPSGVADPQCDPSTGQCSCTADYSGRQCDQCGYGYYGFPDCKPCLCNINGTDPVHCDGYGVCQCEGQTGQCPCKANVDGDQCNQCKSGYYSLRTEVMDGCLKCFCFGRSSDCSEASYFWSKVYSNPIQRVSLTSRAPNIVEKLGELNIIPPGVASVSVLPPDILDPLYWSVTGNITGEKGPEPDIDGSAFWEDERGTFFGALVILESRGLLLQHTNSALLTPNVLNRFQVTLSEEHWSNLEQTSMTVSKPIMMVALHHLDNVYILAAPTAYNYYIELKSVSIEVAGAEGDPELAALGVELCKCPPEYRGESCQLPGPGFHIVESNVHPDWTNLTNHMNLVMQPCSCNNHSNRCDPYSGQCQECQHHTLGNHCERCVPGYYGNGSVGQSDHCQRCACPLLINSNNPTCVSYGSDYMCTNCTEGTTGQHCERCLPDYYGSPSVQGERCNSCACNQYGATNRSCDPLTGQCYCILGITGRSCDQCQPRHLLIGGKCQSCDEGCSGKAMKELDILDGEMENLLDRDMTGFFMAPSSDLLPGTMSWLEQIHNTTIELQEKLDSRDIEGSQDIKDKIKTAEQHVEALIHRVEMAIDEGDTAADSGVKLMDTANKMDVVIAQLLLDLQGNVDSLEELVGKLLHNSSGVNITAALPNARDILREVKDRNFKKYNKAADKALSSAERAMIIARNQHGRLINSSSAALTITDMINRLQDLGAQANTSADNTLDSEYISRKNLKVTEKNKELVIKMQETLTDVESLIADGKFCLTDGEQVLNDAMENMQLSEKKLSMLNAASDELDRKANVLDQSLDISQTLVDLSWAHAYQLLDQASTLNSTFSGARAEAADPLLAAGVYKNIIIAVEEAHNAAATAITDADHTLAMARNETLQGLVFRSMSRSKDLSIAKKIIEHGMTDLYDRLDYVKGNLPVTEKNLNQSADGLRKINRELSKLGQGFGQKVEHINHIVQYTNVVINRTFTLVMRKMTDLTTVLLPKVLEIHPENVREELQYDIDRAAETSKKQMRLIQNLTQLLETQSENISQLKSDLAGKILALKDKIRLARDQANNVKAALSSSGRCVRSFQAPDHTSTSNTLSFNFKTNDTDNNVLLVLLQNSPNEYLSVELNGGKVRFSWNVGGGPGRVGHPEPIERTLGEGQASERWYHVEAKRMGRSGLLKVKPLFGIPLLSEEPELSGTSPPGYSLLTFGNTSHLYVAGLPTRHKTPSGVSMGNFSGCLADLIVDSHKIGLFNFRTTSEHCSACIQAPSVMSTSSEYQFDGTGYAAIPPFQPYSSARYIVSLELKTVWENSLILISANPQTGDYISLELRDGRLLFQYYLGGSSLGVLITKDKYNNNKWVSVTVGRQNLEGLLDVSVASNTQASEKLTRMAAPGNKDLELANHRLYFGGIPQSLQLPKVSVASRRKRRLKHQPSAGDPDVIDVETSSFLGCMRNVQVGSRSLNPVNLLQGDSVGVTEGCKDMGLRVVGFLGDGYVEVTGSSLSKSVADVSLTFQTLYPEGILLLATGAQTKNFYSLALVNGNLQARVNAGSGVLVLTSSKNYTDGQPHNVALIKFDRRIELFVDDKNVEEGDLPVGSGEVTVPTSSGLYIGGVPSGLDVRRMIGTQTGLHGCISDIVINRGLMLLDAPITYSRADIGRCSAAALTSVFSPPIATPRPTVWPHLTTLEPHSTTSVSPGVTVPPVGPQPESTLSTRAYTGVPTARHSELPSTLASRAHTLPCVPTSTTTLLSKVPTSSAAPTSPSTESTTSGILWPPWATSAPRSSTTSQRTSTRSSTTTTTRSISTTKSPAFWTTESIPEEVTSGEVPTSSGEIPTTSTSPMNETNNETFIIVPDTDGKPVTDEPWLMPVSLEPSTSVPRTPKPTDSFDTTSVIQPMASTVTVTSSMVSLVLESTLIAASGSTKELTSPTILTATISVSPAVTETTSSSSLNPTSTSRFVIEPTTVPQTTTTTRQPTTVPSLTILEVSTPLTKPTTTTLPSTTELPTPPPTACAEGDEYEYEDDSISFGNTRSSFAEIKVRRKAVRKHFNIAFDFRTFSPDGMFFYLTNERQSHFVAGQLRDGRVIISYNDRSGGPSRITSALKYSDGLWHSVHVKKGQREISLEVDKSAILWGGIPRKLNVTAPMYVGGLPDSYKIRQGVVSHSIRGCLRKFVVNGGLFRLKNASVISGVGPCFAKVEKGAYFSGFSYGIFAQSFRVGSALVITLSFRTHKTDGVLLTISSYSGAPAMTLELQKGKLKFNMRSSAGVFSAESRYDTDFALCNQRWHNVKAEVIQSFITLQVDGGNTSYAFDRANVRSANTKHALYIGGFPDYARPQGASFSMTNFEGCMKSVFINGIPVDWYNLVQSVDINRVSCPRL